jgi:hypothetical protein
MISRETIPPDCFNSFGLLALRALMMTASAKAFCDLVQLRLKHPQR